MSEKHTTMKCPHYLYCKPFGLKEWLKNTWKYITLFGGGGVRFCSFGVLFTILLNEYISSVFMNYLPYTMMSNCPPHVCVLCVYFEGVALAVILSGVRHISDTVFLEAAKVSSTLTKAQAFFTCLPSSYGSLEKLIPFVALMNQCLAEEVTDQEMTEGRLYPPLSNIREVSIRMAIKVS